MAGRGRRLGCGARRSGGRSLTGAGLDQSRADAARSFLAAAGWAGADRAPLAGDASNRRYERLRGGPGGRGAVLMDAPPERGEDIAPFLAITGHLRALDLSAPEIFAADVAAGFALIEDLGDDLYARLCAANPASERMLYDAAADLLARLRGAPPPVPAGAAPPPYDEAVLVREARLAIDWWAPVAGGDPGEAGAEFDALVAKACADAGAAEDRSALVLRDYHAENLLWLPDRAGDARVGLLDYQGALLGAPAYDLVSLLEDARRDTSEALREAVLARYLARSGDEPAAFRAAYAALGAQRNLKIVGIFARLWLRDGKPAYLDMIPRVWAHLQRDLAHPSLAALAAFVTTWTPAPTAEALARVRAARR